MPLDFSRRLLQHTFQHLACDAVGFFEIGRIAGAAYPPERPEAVVETKRPEDILHIRGVAVGGGDDPDFAGFQRLFAGFEHGSAHVAGFFEEGVTVVPEVHAAGAQVIDCGGMAAERLRHGGHEGGLVLYQQLFGLFKSVACGAIAQVVDVVARRLVGAEFHAHMVMREPLPQVHDIAVVDQADRLAGFPAGFQALDQGAQIGVHVFLQDISVGDPLSDGVAVHFRDDAHAAGDHGGARLRARHAAETGGNEYPAPQVFITQSHPAAGVEQRNRRAMHDALWADVHKRAGRHLSVLRHAEGVEPVPVFFAGIIRDHHAVGDYHARGFGVTGEQAQRVAGVEYQGLVVGHFGEIAHDQPVLNPILEHRAVAPVGNQFVRVFGYLRIEVILDHQHNGSRLAALSRVFADRPGVHRIVGSKAVHINAAVAVELVGEFRGQFPVPLRRKVAQRVLYRKHLFFGGQHALDHAARGMADARIERFGGRQYGGNAFDNLLLERTRLGGGHGQEFFCKGTAVFALGVIAI